LNLFDEEQKVHVYYDMIHDYPGSETYDRKQNVDTGSTLGPIYLDG